MAKKIPTIQLVQGARHESVTVTWTGLNLTNATLSGTKRLLGQTAVTTALDGTFAIVTAASGIFTWTPGAGDVGEAGLFEVQFKAQFSPQHAMTIAGSLRVHEALEATAVAGEAIVGVTQSQRDFLDLLDVDGPTDGQVLTYDSATGEWVNESLPAGASDVDDLTTATGTAGQWVRVAAAGGLEYRDSSQVVGDIGAQGLNHLLTDFSNLDAMAETLPYFTGPSAMQVTPFTDFGRALLDDTSALVARATLGLVIGTDVQAYSAKTAALAALTWAANSIILLTGTATAAVQALAAHVVTFLQSADATAARAAISAAAAADLTSHTGDTGNPHGVTAAQAGAVPAAGGTMSGTLAMADNLITRALLQDYGVKVNAIGSVGGGTQDIDLTLGNVVTATVDTGATTFTFSNPPPAGYEGSFKLYLTNGGSQSVTWPASVDWPAGTAPTLTAAGVDILVFTTPDAGVNWFGFAAGIGMS